MRDLADIKALEMIRYWTLWGLICCIVGVFDTYVNTNLRYSQVAPLDMFTEKNTGNNLPAQFDIYATKGKLLSEHLLERSRWKLWSINFSLL